MTAGRESGRLGRSRARAGTDGAEGEFVAHHALGYDVQQVYLVPVAAKVGERPVDHHLAVRRAVDGEQDLAQRQGTLGLVGGGHLVRQGACQRTGGVGNSERLGASALSVAPRGWGGRSKPTGRARTMTGTATFVASSVTRARTDSDFASRVVPVMVRGKSGDPHRGRGSHKRRDACFLRAIDHRLSGGLFRAV